MGMKSISPIIATILIIVMTVAIAGIFYAFTSGMFGSITQSSSQQIQQQSQVTSFTINNVYCSNNTLYFNIYNNGNIPININNSQIMFTDNNGNTISVNGYYIICNNGNIIPSGSNSLCYIINSLCYYSYTDHVTTTNFVYNGISYNYNIPSDNNFNIIYYLSNYPIIIYNTQSISTPQLFQQDIAICNGSINIGNNFAYVNNQSLFNQINSNGQNVLFFNPDNGQLLYSWYEGQLNYGNTYCDVWWVKLPQGINASSSVTIYMYIGLNNSNYYQQYYPYVGTNEQVLGTMQYDNGQDVFVAYGYFSNTFDGWSGYIYAESFSPTATPYGIEMMNNILWEGTYILPPNNWNIPKIPLIVEEAWYYGGGSPNDDSNAISLFGNTSNQIMANHVWGGNYVNVPASSSSTFSQFDYWINRQRDILASAVTNQLLNSTYFPNSGGTVYSYLIVNSTYAQTGYYIYNSNQAWVPLTLLDTYNINYNGYTYSNLNYNPYRYPTLEISAGTGSGGGSYQYVEWVIARAYPPNGVMPSIYIS
ncbi:MAG: archaellin/type IV pilin N-terminal domain-containing protein [Candidatus Nanopusillus sp.]